MAGARERTRIADAKRRTVADAADYGLKRKQHHSSRSHPPPSSGSALLRARLESQVYVTYAQRAEQKIANIEDKIRSLQKMKRSLKKIVSQCENRDAVDDCPLWLGLDEPRKKNTG